MDHMKKLGDCLNIVAKDVISIVGAGGKTSLIMYLSEFLEGRRLVSASTKMYKPLNNWPCYINEPYTWSSGHEVIVAAKEEIGLKISKINPYTKEADFDYWLIEADGSRGLPLKGWAEHEPVIIGETTVTIGIVDISTLGKTMDDQLVFQLDEFKAMVGKQDRVTIDTLAKMISHEDGLFKKSKGRRLLLINKAEDLETISKGQELLKRVSSLKQFYRIDDVIIGSVMNGKGFSKGIS